MANILRTGGLVRLMTAFVLIMAGAIPAAAQTTRPATPAPTASAPDISFRPFFVARFQRFAAQKTFDAVFDSASGSPFWGGGLELDLRRNIFIEIAASRFSKTGQRAFVSDGQVFQLGIPLQATLTPFEVTAGYRFPLGARPPRGRTGTGGSSPMIFPYIGGGVGRYAYSETSDFGTSADDIDASHVGFIGVGGVEVRAHRWIAVSVDAQFTHVGGILGSGGVSKEFGETDLGGTSVRVRVLVGR